MRGRPRFRDDVEVDGVTYASAVEQTVNEVDDVRGGPPESRVVRVVFARGAGLVEFERLDGQVFTRTGLAAR